MNAKNESLQDQKNPEIGSRILSTLKISEHPSPIIKIEEEEEEEDEDEYGRDQMQQDGHEGRWNDNEHDKFREGILIYGKNWNKVAEFVKSRTSAQTRSHA